MLILIWRGFYYYSGSRDNSGYIATLGSHEVDTVDPNQVNFKIEKIILHPDYNNRKLENDVCLLKLDGQVCIIGCTPLIQSHKLYSVKEHVQKR